MFWAANCRRFAHDLAVDFRLIISRSGLISAATVSFRRNLFVRGGGKKREAGMRRVNRRSTHQEVKLSAIMERYQDLQVEAHLFEVTAASPTTTSYLSSSIRGAPEVGYAARRVRGTV
jgi:hypothetical protein